MNEGSREDGDGREKEGRKGMKGMKEWRNEGRKEGRK